MHAVLQRLRRFRSGRAGGSLWLAIALLVLAVQTTLPAHEESHSLGHADTLCQYCVLGGHLYSLSSTPPPVAPAQLHGEAPLGVFASVIFTSRPRSVFTRGPPSFIANA